MMNNPHTQAQLQKITAFVKRHSIVILVVFFAAFAAYILVLTASLSQADPSEEKLSEQQSAVARPNVSPDTVQTIQSLEDRNVKVQAIFEKARENPFTE